MRRRWMGCAVVVATLVLGAGICEAAQLPVPQRDPKIATRVLTDADMEKYIAILKKIKEAQKAMKTPAEIQAVVAKKRAACEENGWTTIDYDVLNARVTGAMTLIQIEKSNPVPAERKAEVELVRKWKTKIEEAKRP